MSDVWKKNQSLQQTIFLTVFGSKSGDRESEWLFLDIGTDTVSALKEKLPFRNKEVNRNTNSKQYFSLSVYPAQWPPDYLMVTGKLCMVIVKQEKSCSVCIFGQALPPRCCFSTRGSSCADHTPPIQTRKSSLFTDEPAALGALPGTKAISPHCSTDSKTAPGRRQVSLGYQPSQQEQETLRSLGAFLKPC